MDNGTNDSYKRNFVFMSAIFSWLSNFRWTQLSSNNLLKWMYYIEFIHRCKHVAINSFLYSTLYLLLLINNNTHIHTKINKAKEQKNNLTHVNRFEKENDPFEWPISEICVLHVTSTYTYHSALLDGGKERKETEMRNSK